MANSLEKLIPTIKEIKSQKEKLEKEGFQGFSKNWNNLSFAINSLLSKIEEKAEFIKPMVGRISAPFGEKRKNSKGETYYHSGIDIADNPANKTPILAAKAGAVVRAEEFGAYGLCVDILHDNSYLTRYAHCSKFLVKKGDKVTQGQQIAIVGSTGRSTGPHLHFEIRKNNIPVNPMEYIFE